MQLDLTHFHLRVMEISYWHVVFPLMWIPSFAAAFESTIIDSGLRKNEIMEILDYHNNYRASVANGQVETQPGAQDMQEMKWDNALQRKAQRWADRMEFKGDRHLRDGRFKHVGQNMYMSYSSSPKRQTRNFRRAIDVWFNEVYTDKFDGEVRRGSRHYSQMIWAKSNLLGCGYTYFKEATLYNELFFCNYGPGGNIYLEYPYILGEPDCEASNLKQSTKYPGLCISS